MTTLKVTRLTAEGKPYDAYIPVGLAPPQAFDHFMAEHLREWLHRQGCQVEHISDETLLMQVRNTFQSTSLRDGVTTATPVVLGE